MVINIVHSTLMQLVLVFNIIINISENQLFKLFTLWIHPMTTIFAFLLLFKIMFMIASTPSILFQAIIILNLLQTRHSGPSHTHLAPNINNLRIKLLTTTTSPLNILQLSIRFLLLNLCINRYSNITYVYTCFLKLV